MAKKHKNKKGLGDGVAKVKDTDMMKSILTLMRN